MLGIGGLGFRVGFDPVHVDVFEHDSAVRV